MRIVISDVNRIWTPDHPALEPYADNVLVICLNGKKVTDNYKCVVSPFSYAGLGFIPFGMDSIKFQALCSIEDQLTKELSRYEDVVFLTDMEPEGLYPFIVVKDKKVGCSLHLFSITPWKFETKRRKKAVNSMLMDLSALNSVLLLDGEFFLWKAKRTATLPELIHNTQIWCGDILPSILDQIQDRKWDRAFFDTSIMQYVPLEEGENLTNTFIQNVYPSRNEETFSYTTTGLVQKSDYPSRDRDTLDEIEAIIPRIDGKRICDYLRDLRLKLADANQIPFESKECPSIGPCAGTCRKCDLEAEYLRNEMEKIAPENRVYPQEKLTSWEVF